MRADESVKAILETFSDPDVVAKYTEGPPRFVPGYSALHRMTGIMLAEKVPADARVLVLGAGGGLEIKALAEEQPTWSFVGVDPSVEMLELAEQTLGDHSARVHLKQGYIDDAPDGPFEAATCLLTLHFLDADERRRTAAEIHRRLKPGAPFVAAHSSFPQGDHERGQWLSRYAAYAVASGADPEKVQQGRSKIETSLCLFSPEQDEALLREAGFSNVTQFYAAFTFRGWVGYA